jgi:hypothetical protein
MTRSLPLIGLVAALALAAACGTAAAQTPAAQPSADPAAIYRQFAQCVRDHGQPDFPDPTLDSQGQPQLPPGVEKPPTSIMQACASILNRLPASLRPRSATANDPAMMRRFAQCMRAHGIDDWPDPNADGTFTMPPTLGNIKTNPRWSRIQAAWTGPCRQYNPSGHISGNP